MYTDGELLRNNFSCEGTDAGTQASIITEMIITFQPCGLSEIQVKE